MILAISGTARAGKDTVADYLVKHHGYTKMSFADPMREALYKLNPLVRTIEGTIVHLAQLVDTAGWENTKEITNDLRVLMQRLGTEVGREMFGQDFWVNLALSKVSPNQRVVFSDCRFQNEANAVKAVGGEIWRVERPGFAAANDHISEHDLDEYFFEFIFENKSSLDDLYLILEDYLLESRINV